MVFRLQQVALGLALALVHGTAARGGDPDFGKEPYPYRVKNQEIRQVLQEFGDNLNYKVVISPDMKERVLDAAPAATPFEFLEALSAQYAFDWYYDGMAIHFTPKSENVPRFLLLDGVTFDRFVSELSRLSVLSPRVAVQPTPGARFVTVIGPPRFVAVCGQVLLSLTTNTDTGLYQTRARPTNTPLTVYRGKDVNVLKFKPAE